jgi:hypothetical protein
MPFAEAFAPFFADFGEGATLAGVAVRGMVNVESFDELDTVVQRTDFLLQPTAAVTAAVGQSLVLRGTTYTVRQVLKEPPDGVLQRLVLARA